MVLSANGKFAAFETNGVPDAYSRIYVKNLETGSIELVNEPGAYDDSLTTISADRRTVAFWSGNPAYGGPGTVMRNLDTGITTLICRQYSGNLFEVRTFARISSGANYAVWDSSFASFVPGDTNVATDTFLRRLS
jgi:hypothetical protein